MTVNAGTSAAGPAAPIDWAGVEAVVKGTSLPVIVKGITSPADAKQAVAHGAKGVVISNYRGGNAASLKGTLLLIKPVVQAVGDRTTILVDGSFRYGSDVIKALGFGAKGVLIGRPVMWGLAAYGADGVQSVVEFLQTDLARFMAMCGRPNLASIEPSLVRVHGPYFPRGPSYERYRQILALESFPAQCAWSAWPGFMAASPIAAAAAQIDPRPFSEHHRIKTLPEMRTAFDFEPIFFGNLPASITEYTAHGDGSEFNLRRNRQAFDWVDIVSNRPAIPASQVDLSTELFGAKMKYPIMVGPSAVRWYPASGGRGRDVQGRDRGLRPDDPDRRRRCDDHQAHHGHNRRHHVVAALSGRKSDRRRAGAGRHRRRR